VYGIIMIGALLAAESAQHDGYLDTVASAAIAAALYWLAHAYSGLLGGRLAQGERLSVGALLGALAHDWPIVRGAALPLAALVLCWALGAARSTGVTVALWSSIVGVMALEVLAGVRARAGARELTLDAGVGAAMGIAILALKIVLH
jgi:hypothetical protein